jgi:hypothetical protein
VPEITPEMRQSMLKTQETIAEMVSHATNSSQSAMKPRPNLSLNPDALPAALRAVRSAPVSLVRWAAQC